MRRKKFPPEKFDKSKYVIEKLSDDDLQKVSGGDCETDGKTFTGHIGKYDGVVGRCYYIVHDDINMDAWAYGELIKTYEKDVGWWIFSHTERHHVIRVRFGHWYWLGGEEVGPNELYEFSGDRRL